MNEDNLADVVISIETELNVQVGFLRGLLKENDWSFLVKGHAFVEAAVSHAIVRTLEKPELNGLITRLELGVHSTGKLAFAEALNVFGTPERRFIRYLSKLRNDMVHDVSQVDFDLKNYVKSLDQNQLKGFTQAFGYFAGDPKKKVSDSRGTKMSLSEFITAEPKTAIWYSLMNFAGVAYLSPKLARNIDQLKKITLALDPLRKLLSQ